MLPKINDKKDEKNLSFYQKLKKEGDVYNFLLLLILYTLQGIPMGLGGSIPILLQNNSSSYTNQAIFSLVSWPFSLKLLWAPLVDTFLFKYIW